MICAATVSVDNRAIPRLVMGAQREVDFDHDVADRIGFVVRGDANANVYWR